MGTIAGRSAVITGGLTGQGLAIARALAEHGVSCSAPSDQRWGIVTTLRLPGGGSLGLYEPRHDRATEL